MVKKRLFQKLFLFFMCLPMRTSAQTHTVCAIGDSQVEPGAMFVADLQQELGPEYHVIARGRRSWTTQQWIEAGDFAHVCGNAEVILISLGGNDINHGVTQEEINRNIDLLLTLFPTRPRLVYHMEIPRFYRPRLDLTEDGVHLTQHGARAYARIVAPHLRLE